MAHDALAAVMQFPESLWENFRTVREAIAVSKALVDVVVVRSPLSLATLQLFPPNQPNLQN